MYYPVPDNLKRLVPRRVAVILLGIVFGLLLAHGWGYFNLTANTTWAKLLDVNHEKNFATAFSGGLLLSCAALLGLIAQQYQKGAATQSKKPQFTPYWWALCFLFVGMAVDELVQIHERVNVFLDDRVQLQTSGFFYYDWVILGLIFVGAIALIYAPFLKHLTPSTRRQFLLAAGIYIAGALGMEMISGQYVDLHGLHNRGVLTVLNGIEEAGEMIGLIVFIHALLIHLQALVYRTSAHH
ncbi:MAG: hypothetical protein AAFR58_21840 [Cyanobacteria bacterium J06627_28]